MKYLSQGNFAYDYNDYDALKWTGRVTFNYYIQCEINSWRTKSNASR